MHLRQASIVAPFCVGLFRPILSRADGSDTEFFEKKIRPVLVESCYECHSSRAKVLKGELRLDSAEAVRAGGETGPVVAPGSPEKSRLIDAIRYQNADLQMPPKERLAASKIDDLTEWVKRGARGRRQAPASQRRIQPTAQLRSRNSICQSGSRRTGPGNRLRARRPLTCNPKLGPRIHSTVSC